MSLFFRTIHDLPRMVPLLTSGDIIMPRCALSIDLSLKDLSVRAIKRFDIGALVGCLQVYTDSTGKKTSYQMGCLARVTGLGVDTDQEILQVNIQGICRFRLVSGAIIGALGDHTPVDYGRFSGDLYDTSPMFGLDVMQTPLFEKLMTLYNALNVQKHFKISGSVSYDHMLNGLTMAMPFRAAEKQLVLESSTLQEKEKALDFLLADTQIMMDVSQRTSH